MGEIGVFIAIKYLYTVSYVNNIRQFLYIDFFDNTPASI